MIVESVPVKSSITKSASISRSVRVYKSGKVTDNVDMGSDFYVSTILSDSRWRAYDYEKLINCDKASLDIFWLRDESLEESDNLPDPDVLAQEIIDDLEAALEQFREIAMDLGSEGVKKDG